MNCFVCDSESWLTIQEILAIILGYQESVTDFDRKGTESTIPSNQKYISVLMDESNITERLYSFCLPITLKDYLKDNR